jgi:hypothetical protein
VTVTCYFKFSSHVPEPDSFAETSGQKIIWSRDPNYIGERYSRKTILEAPLRFLGLIVSLLQSRIVLRPAREWENE